MADIILTLSGEAQALAIVGNYRNNKVVAPLDKWVDLQENAGGDDYADTGTTVDETTQANELWVAGHSIRDGDFGLERTYINGFTEVLALDDVAGLQITMADKIAAATGHPRSRLTPTGMADNQSLVASFKAAAADPIEFVQYAYGWTEGAPAAGFTIPLYEDYQENDLLVLWVVMDYTDATSGTAGRPTFSGDISGWTRIDDMNLDDHFWAIMYYTLAPAPPSPPPSVIGIAGEETRAAGTLGHVISGPTGASV